MARCTRIGNRKERGFTLLELLAVVVIIGLLVGIAIPRYMNTIARAREAALKQNLHLMRSLIDQYFADKGHYPERLEDLVTDGYLRTIPVDPMTESNSTWQTIMADSSPLGDDMPPGIFDVKSGASGIGLDGVPYADW
jgi:general secretion pathway protein G